MLKARFLLDVEGQKRDGSSVLAHAVMFTTKSQRDIVPVIEVLLKYFTKPGTIPQHMWEGDLKKQPTIKGSLKAPTPWTADAQEMCIGQLNFSIRSRLRGATKAIWQPTLTGRSMAKGGLEDLLHLHTMIEGQKVATILTQRLILNHLTDMKTSSPLVLAFAGVFGSEETKLARALKDVLGNLPFKEIKIKLGQMRDRVSLFGPDTGLVGNETGAPLANFLKATREEAAHRLPRRA